MTIFTVGHSTLSEEDFLKVLQRAPEQIKTVVDVRSHPVSKWPQHRIENLRKWLPAAGINYVWEPRLGGWSETMPPDRGCDCTYRELGVDLDAYRRGKFPKQTIAQNLEPGAKPSWTNKGLLDYSVFELTPEFLAGAEWLIDIGRFERVAIMCAETLWWKCHRSMIADYLAYRGVESFHLQPRLTAHSKALGNRLSRYNPAIWKVWRKHSKQLA